MNSSFVNYTSSFTSKLFIKILLLFQNEAGLLTEEDAPATY